MALNDLPMRAEASRRHQAAGGRAAAPAPDLDEPNLDEASLVAQIGKGDANAFRQIVELHLDPIVGFARRVLNDRAEADDIAQETFLRLWRDAHRWQPRARLAAWLYRVAYNLCIDSLRKRRGMVDIDQMPDPPSPAPGPEDEIAAAEQSVRIERAISELPERQRAAILLVHRQGLGNIAAAEILGVSVEALESLLARGRRQLKQVLGLADAAAEGGKR